MRHVLLAAATLASASPATSAVLDANWTENATWASNAGNTGHTGLAWAPDGSDRLFVIEKGGRIRVFSGATTTGTGTWSTFATETVFTNSECGLIGMAFDPNYVVNRHVYFFVTVSSSEQRIVRYTDVGNLGTARLEIVTGLPTVGNNHDGGGLGFGWDGKLYWSIGDLGNGTGVDANLTSLAAKVGRANRDGSLPDDNPFADGPGGNNDFIWARGMRNPFTMRFQPSTGQLWLNVVGDSFEQVFVVNAGDHGGYNDYENTQPAGFITPKIVYPTSTAPAAINLSAATRAGNVATFTTADPHRLRVGSNVTIANVADASFNGPNQYVTAVLSNTQFSVAQNAPNASAGGGTMTPLAQGRCLSGGEFFDASTGGAAYHGNFFYGDCVSGRVMRARLDPVTNVVRGVDHFATGFGGQVDAALGPDGALYFTGNGPAAVRRVSFNATAQGLVVAGQNVRLDEGGRAVITVSLAQAPAAAVTVNVARTGGDADLGVADGSVLTFTPGNWNQPQAVTLAAENDPDLQDDAATLAVSAAGLAPVGVRATALDLGAGVSPAMFSDGFED